MKTPKQYLIDIITENALDIFCTREFPVEAYRNITVYCNNKTKDLIEKEVNEKSMNISYIQRIDKLDKAARDFGAHISINGIRIKFKVDDKYSMLILVLDSLSNKL